MVSDDIAMGDADEPSTAGTKGAEPGIGKGKGDGEGTTEERRRANENVRRAVHICAYERQRKGKHMQRVTDLDRGLKTIR